MSSKGVALAAAGLWAVAGTLPVAAQGPPKEPTEEELTTIPVVPIPDETEPEVATVLETMEVTGSRLKRADFETAQPITVIDSAQIARSGLVNVGELLQALPAAGAAQNRLVNVFGRGTTEIDLRNMGSQRILVLVNGHRWVRSADAGNTGAVDLNTIPVSIIERIEVLKDGASAIYGSEAISGVINIITRKDYVGSALHSQVGGFPEYGDGLTQAHGVSFGAFAGRTSVFLNLGYVQQQAVFAGDREISKLPAFGTGMSRGISATPSGHPIFIPNSANGSALGEELCPTFLGARALVGIDPEPGGATLPVTDGVQFCDMVLRPGQTITGEANETTGTVAARYKPFNYASPDPAVSDNYNMRPLQYLATPFEQGSFFGQLFHPIASNLSLAMPVFYNVARTRMQLAESGSIIFGDFYPGPFHSVYIDAAQAFNPFDQDIGRHAGQDTPSDTLGFGVGSGLVQRRLVEAGPRILKRDKDTWLAGPSLTGDLDWLGRVIHWDTGGLYARSEAKYLYTGDIRTDRLKLALGPPDACAAAPGCVPLNIFGAPGAITGEMLDFILYESHNSSRATMQDFYFNSSLPVGGLGFLDSPLLAAFGVEYRDEQFSEQPDPNAVTGMNGWGFDIPEATQGGYAVQEAFLELEAPLLSRAFLANDLDLILAGRYTKYEIFDQKVTGKMGLRWKPVEDLLVRGTASQAFRGPSVTDLYAGARSTLGFGDPCRPPLTGQRTPGTVEDQNCDADGVPETVPPQAGWTLNTGGNPDLKPETGYSFTAGFVYSPEFIPDLNLYADWFKVELTDFIENLNSTYIMDTCYREPRSGGVRPQTCDYVIRRPDGTIESVRAVAFNFAYVRTDGLDVALDYVLPLAGWVPALNGAGQFKLTFDSTYLNRFDRAIPAADGSIARTGFAGVNRGDQVFPRFKANGALVWSRDNWDAAWMVRYIGATVERCNDYYQFVGGPPSLRDLGVCSDPDPDLSDGSDDSKNRLDATFYHDVQVGHVLPDSDLRMVVGALNLLDQDPPVSYAAFTNSFPSTAGYQIPGIQAYVRLQKSF